MGCLILLGEPGMGKSSEWQSQKQVPVAGTSHFANLGDFSTGRDIVEALEQELVVQQWLSQPAMQLWLWLDSFDEALTQESKLAQTLRRMLEKWPLPRLHLRILSRTATWPSFFTDDLHQRFDKPEQPSQVAVLQLAPLTRAQLGVAAKEEGIAPQEFLAAIERAEAVALVIRPVTLHLLIRLWKAKRFGPSVGRGIDLLEAGCRLLCEEGWDEQRQVSPLYDPDRRLRIAGHIALLMVGSNRRVLTRSETEATEVALRLSDITGENTLTGDKPSLLLDLALVRDVLDHTGLFVPNATHVVWAHQAYADFLAAWALHQAKVPMAQLRNLFRSAVPGAGVVPALRDTAVWLASLSSDFSADLLQMDSLTALRAELLTASPVQCATLVDHLFALTYERHLYPRRAEPYLARLAHSGLAAQLEMVLANPDETPEARWLAHQLADSCMVQELTPLLTKLTLDVTLPIRIRTDAIRSLRHFADPTIGAPLRLLINAVPMEDSDDEFRGTLLHLLWPNFLTVQELIPLLTREKSRNYTGAYRSFISPAFAGGLRDGITPTHLPALLCWAVRRNKQPSTASSTIAQRVCESAVAAAWQHTEVPRVAAWLGFALRHLLRSHSGLIVPTAKLPRHHIIQQLAARNQLPSAYYLTLLHPSESKRYPSQEVSKQALFGNEDWDFLLDLLSTTSARRTLCVLFSVANQLLNGALPATSLAYQTQFAALYDLAHCKAFVPEELGWAWEIESDYAHNNRERLYYEQKAAKEQRVSRQQTHRMNGRTFRLLIRLSDPVRTDIRNSWGYVWWLLTRSGQGMHNALSSSVREGFHWLRSSTLLKQRIVVLAQRFVTHCAPDLHSSRINSVSSTETIHLAALVLCLEETPDFVGALTSAEWFPWVNLLLYANIASEGHRPQLLAVALNQHASAVVRQIVRTTDFRHQLVVASNGHAYLVDLLRDTPHEGLRRVALFSITAGYWSVAGALVVLEQLLAWHFRPAELFRDALLAQNPDGPALHRLTYVVFRAALFEAEDDSAWWTSWQQIIRFGPVMVRHLLGSVEGRPSWEGPVPTGLTDAQLGTLLQWLVSELGVTEENGSDDWRSESSATRTRNFRNTVAKRLAGRATAEAWEALNQLAVRQNYPRWLTYTLEEAAETYSRVEWQPLAPVELLRFLRHATNRWVQSGGDLLDALIESFGRLQERLQGEPAQAHFLWYPTNETGYRIRNGKKVREENEVTDYVQAFLAADLPQHIFSIKREVQIRASSGTQKGQELDLYVDAVARNANSIEQLVNRITVFVEAKHNDNREVLTALDGQLVNRYLRNHSANEALFLVYWHTAEKGRSTSRGSLAGLRQELAQQAQAASVNGRLIRSLVLDIRMPDDQT